MWDKVVVRVRAKFQGHRELAGLLPETAFTQRLPMRSNNIGQQYWCIVGARESYTKGIGHGAWVGFSCSLTSSDLAEKKKILAALDRSVASFDLVASQAPWDDARTKLLLDLLEHETQHQGQLIRYVYGLGHKFPETWLQRWALEQA
ncbi:MAG: hypothetical protein WEA61_09700 [Anaerolineales bacterium]